MIDWNMDGKHDWHDDYVYHEHIKSKHGNTTKNKPVSSNDHSAGCLFFVVIFFLMLISK